MEMFITSSSAQWFLPFATVISIWVAWSDMKFLKIPNKAVLALFAVFVVIGFFALPFEEYLWRFAHLGIILLIGFVMSALGFLGAGDAKFAAAMAPFVALEDAGTMLFLMSGVFVISLIMHRLFQSSKAIRKMTTDWKSWDTKDFPMGLALGGSLVAYLALGVVYGQ